MPVCHGRQILVGHVAFAGKPTEHGVDEMGILSLSCSAVAAADVSIPLLDSSRMTVHIMQ